MGVDVIEAGFAAASKGDTACITAICKTVKNATICSLARGIKADIEAAARALEKAKETTYTYFYFYKQYSHRTSISHRAL